MIYSESNRSRFDEAANHALGLLTRQFGRVVVLPPEETSDGSRWFVQIQAEVMDVPFGAFGETPARAANRLLKMTAMHEGV